MTPKQTAWYFREWAAVRRIQPEADRHEFHIRALGKDRSSKLFTNRDFDRVLQEFWKVTKPTDLNAQVTAENQTRTRALHTIRSFPVLYVLKLCSERFGTREIEHLTLEQLCQFAMTLNCRRESLDDREIRAAEAATELVGTHSTASHETATEGDPY